MRDSLRTLGAGCLLAALASTTTALAADSLYFKLDRNLETARHRTMGFVFPLTWYQPDQLAEGAAELQSGKVFNKSPDRVDECEEVVSMPTSMASHHAGVIYGGVCTMTIDGRRQRAAICLDNMVGDSAIRLLPATASPANDRRTAALLMLDVCYGT